MFDYALDEGGYGWCVVAASFLLHAVVGGITYSCGVIHIIFQNYFNDTSHFLASWIGALMLGLSVLAGIPGTVLTYKLGYRLTVVIGGLLAAGGMAFSGFCTEYYQVLLSFGALSGIGFGIALTPSVMILDHYFCVKRTIALSFAVAGSSLGLIVIPIAAYYLEDYFAWKGMALIFAGLCFNICLCGAAMRSRDEPVGKHRKVYLKIFETGLCQSSAFIAISFSNIFWSLGTTIIFMYIPGYAVHVGQTLEDGVILVGIIGLSSFISRPIFQMFTHSAKLDHTSVLLCTVALSTIMTGLHPEMFTHKAGQIGYATIFGLHCAFWTTFVSYISTELIAEEYVGMGRGFTTMCIAVGLIGGGPLAGWLLDELEDDYEVIFYLAGACLLFSSCILGIANMKKCYFRPMADWCDSDSESSTASSKTPLNTCSQEEIRMRASDAAHPCFYEETIPRFTTACELHITEKTCSSQREGSASSTECTPQPINSKDSSNRHSSPAAACFMVSHFPNNDCQYTDTPSTTPNLYSQSETCLANISDTACEPMSQTETCSSKKYEEVNQPVSRRNRSSKVDYAPTFRYSQWELVPESDV